MRERLRTGALVAALVLATAGCDWSMLGFGAGRSSFSAFETRITPANAPQLHELWHTDVGTAAKPPVAADGKVFTLGGVSGHGELRAYDAATGGCSTPSTCSPLWTQSLDSWFEGPVVAGHSVYAGGWNIVGLGVGGGTFYNVVSVGGGHDLDTGAPVPGGVATAEVVTGDGGVAGWVPRVFYQGSPYPYFAYQLTTGDTTLYDGFGGAGTPGPTPGTTSIVDGRAYVSTGGGVMVLPATGGCSLTCPVLWSTQAAATVSWDSLPTVDKGFVYVSEVNGTVEAFPTTGCGRIPDGHCTATWRAHAGTAHLSGVAVDDSTLFVGSDDGHLYAFPAAGCGAAVCEPSWSVDLSHAVHNPSVAGGSVFAPTDDGRVAVIDAHGCGAASCTPAWVSTASGSPVRWAPVVADGRVLTLDDTGRLRVFGLGA
jgi:hypothetical protein